MPPSWFVLVFLFYTFAVAMSSPHPSVPSMCALEEQICACLWERPCQCRPGMEEASASLALSNIFSFLIFLLLLDFPLNMLPLIGSDSLIT